MKLLSLFSGIGAFEKALENLNIDFELVNFCEIDKYASKSYSVIHNVSQDKNLIDVTKVDTSKLPNDIDLVTYGFPCQDISQAGKQQGFINANGVVTRSGLFFEALRIIKDTKPKYAIAENVKALTSKKFAEEFMTVLSSLKDAGYHNYFKVLNAKDFGIPQNRERVFIVSIREDIDDGFVFPDKEPLLLRLKDMLQDNVDEKYYLNDSQIKRIKDTTYNQGKRRIQEKDYCDTLCARDYKDPQCVRVFGLYDTNKTICLNSKGGRNGVDGLQPSVQDRVYSVDGIATACTTSYQTNIAEPMICASRGRNPEDPSDRTVGTHTEQRLEINKQGISNTLTTVQKDNYVLEPTDRILQVGNIVDTGNFDNPQRERIYSQEGISPALNTVGGGGLEPKIIDLINYRIRKLTPTECWRLMGFTDEDINKCIAAGISNSQLYKQAGNSIVVNVLEKILRNLLGD